MRTRFASLSAAFVALVVLAGPAAAFDSTTPELAVMELTAPASLTQSVVALTDVVSEHISVVGAEMERFDEEARLQRILARRGKPLQLGWYVRQGGHPVERPVSYGNHSGSPLIVATIRDFNTEISAERATKLAGLIETTANRYGVDPLLVTALVSQESAFYQSATSSVGATGLGQLMPETAADLGVNPSNAAENLDGCVRYLADLLYQWSGSEDPTALALASYNAGAGNVELYNGIPPFEETQNYVAVIKDRYATLSTGNAIAM